jgi:CRP/FNR family transcriptional regulator, cyclic AMP receptor protein
MGNPTRSRDDNARVLSTPDDTRLRSDRASALDENVQAIKRWERAILLARTRAEQVSDWIACTAGSGLFLILHGVWFGAWVTMNTGAISAIRPWDPFPFPFLTMTVSLEAIFLALIVLASQNRLGRQADKRSHLDL